ncbi:MAG TPA: tautomerase family protein [Opitutales bacterium]|nr:tautomerase family protein [Opitutales bacterium]
MSQVKVFGRREHLQGKQQAISDVIQRALVESLGLPADKRFHRFIALDDADFFYPSDRSVAYTILEISMFVGRSKDTKKQLIRALFAGFEKELGIAPNDLEITIFETPRENWGIRGLPGDELVVSYRVET